MRVEGNYAHEISCNPMPPSGPPLRSCQSLRNKLPYGQQVLRFGVGYLPLPLALTSGKVVLSEWRESE